MRKTKIVCTIGPASESEEKLKELIAAGMNVARFNFSHGTHEEHKAKFERVKKVSEELGVPLAIMQDTKGPEIRLRDFENGSAMLQTGSVFELTTEEVLGGEKRASISYKNLKDDVKVGDSILINDGAIEMKVKEITGSSIFCDVINGGKVSNHKGINVPGAILSMPYVSEADLADLLFGIKMGYDYVAISFVRCAEDVREIRRILAENGGKAKIISKIENMQGIQNLDEILEASDGLMVARGDMGVEIPLEEVPAFQKKMIAKAVQLGKVVITATQMLESMIHNPRPTRAETADVANAVYDGTSAVMLSGESAVGAYPVEAVKMMGRIARHTETQISYQEKLKNRNLEDNTDTTSAICHACCTTAIGINAKAIITVTMSGFTANMIAKHQPHCPVIGCTADETVYRQMALLFGVTPLLINKADDMEALFADAIQASLKAGLVEKGDQIVLTAGVPLGAVGNTNMIRVMEV